MMNFLNRAKELSSRGMQEQIDWLVSLNWTGTDADWLTLAAEYDSVGAQAEGEPITDIDRLGRVK